MMNFRPLLLASAAAAALSLMAAAPGTHGAHAHRAGFMRLVHSLGLSDNQKAQIKALVQQYRQQHPEGSEPDPQARKALRQQVLGVLTPQQREQLKDDMQRSRSGQQPAAFGPSPAPLPEETAQP